MRKAIAARPARKVSPAQASVSMPIFSPAAERLDQLQRDSGADRRNAEQEGEARAVGPGETRKRAAVMVTPERLVPGMSASACASR